MAPLHSGAGEIIEKEVLAACRIYKIDPQTARKIFTELWEAFPNLDDALNAGKDPCRLAAYKQFVKKARKGIYYQLRRYKGDSGSLAQLCELLRQNEGNRPDSGPVAQIVNELLAAHVSTAERTPYYKDFYGNFFAAVSPPKSILDIGCGLHPLSYPFFSEQGKKLSIYIAMDKDTEVIRVLKAFSGFVRPAALVPICADLEKDSWEEILPPGTARFELALALKLVPVLKRRQPAALANLAKAPADKMLVTASSQSMTKKREIARREKKALQDFATLVCRSPQALFEIENEFGFFL
jgi:16S rRNA (guanine(1405)-N(7))-methyltransferase